MEEASRQTRMQPAAATRVSHASGSPAAALHLHCLIWLVWLASQELKASYAVLLAAAPQNRLILYCASEELRHSELLEGVLEQDPSIAESWLFARCQNLEAELASVKAELAVAYDENRNKDKTIDAAVSRLEKGTKSVAPYMEEVTEFAMLIPDMRHSDDIISVPVGALRFTHHTVNAEMAFGEDHENKQESIFKLIDGLFRGHILPLALALFDLACMACIA